MKRAPISAPRPLPSKRELWESMTDAQLTRAMLMLPEDARDEAIERSGIQEFLGGIPRRQATIAALMAAGRPKAGFVTAVRSAP